MFLMMMTMMMIWLTINIAVNLDIAYHLFLKQNVSQTRSVSIIRCKGGVAYEDLSSIAGPVTVVMCVYLLIRTIA
jgi:hypothetical protein